MFYNRKGTKMINLLMYLSRKVGLHYIIYLRFCDLKQFNRKIKLRLCV